MTRPETASARLGWLLVLVGSFSLAGFPGEAGAAPSIRARIQPNQIGLGQDARLEVVVSGASNAPTPRPAPVPGLRIQGLGQTMSMQFVGGAMTTETTHTYAVRPERTGEFEIPAITLTIGGRAVSTRPLTLSVLPAGEKPRPNEAAEGPSSGSEEKDPGAANLEDVALLRIDGVPDRELYLGEVIPVEIQLFIREGTRVTEASPPRMLGSGFTLSRPSDDEPVQRRVRLDDGVYTRLTFPAALSPVAAGDLALTAALDLTARVPKRVPRTRRRFDDPFFDSFFDSFAYRAVEQKIPVRSAETTVRVASLPTKDRPPGFTGAVGQFSMTTTADPLDVAVGDPITLRVDVSGRGNFDRLQLPAVERSASWRAYDPTETFEPSDRLGIQGQKTFEQALLPLQPDVRELVLPEVSYFDPERQRYVTLSADPLPIEVRGAPGGPRTVPVGRTRAGVDVYELAPNAIELGAMSTSLWPNATRAWFAALQGLPVLALAGAIWWGRRRRARAGDPERLRAAAMRAELNRLRQDMDDAVDAGDATRFFEAARRALQERLTGLPGTAAARSLTLREVDERLVGHPETAARVRALFQAADALAYGGAPSEGSELARSRDEVSSVLETLDQLEEGS